MKCLNCGKRKAQFVPPYGYLNCKVCTDKAKKIDLKETIEVVPDSIKEARKEYATDVLQRYRGHVANKQYIKKYGKEGFTDEEIRGAKDVFPGYYNDE